MGIGELKRSVLLFESGLSGAKNGRRHTKEREDGRSGERPDVARLTHLPSCCFAKMAPKRLLVVFDFDWYFPNISVVDVFVLIVSARSMADQDTDRYIFEVNAIDLRRKMRNLQDTVQWTDLM